MSIPLMEKCSQYVTDAGLAAGVERVFMRWNDSYLKGRDFLLFRQDGGGDSNELLQQINVRIVAVVKPEGDAKVISFEQMVGDLARLFRESLSVPNGVQRFEVIQEPSGAMEMEDGRLWWQLTIRVYTEDM